MARRADLILKECLDAADHGEAPAIATVRDVDHEYRERGFLYRFFFAGESALTLFAA